MEDIGDDEHPMTAGDVDVGGTAVAVAAGFGRTCALIDDGSLRCWGRDLDLSEDIGDDETPASVDPVDVGGAVELIAMQGSRTCAILEGGAVRCWGLGGWGGGMGPFGECDGGGPLGYGNNDNVYVPASAGDIDLGGVAVSLAVGGSHTCALLNNGAVRCWGCSDDGHNIYPGRLGYGNKENIGDDETPASAGDVDVGGTVAALSATNSSTCALLDNGAVRCWGSGGSTRALGYGNEENIGDDEVPASAGDMDIGGSVIALTGAGRHMCALLLGGSVRCWGQGTNGILGYVDELPVGDDETPADMGDVDVGGIVETIVAGHGSTCVNLGGWALRCWGYGDHGALGYANEENIGDDELPSSVGLVQYQ